MSTTIANRIPNIPVWGSTAFGVAKGDWVGQDSAGNDLVIPAVKLTTGAAGVDGGYVTAANPLPVTVVSGGGGGGSGTQYATGTAVATPTGTASLGWDGTNVRVLATTAGGVLKVDGSAVTQPVSAAALPLPTGAATEATLGGVLTTANFQARVNTLGQKTMAASTPVVLASDQAAVTVSQATAANLNASVVGPTLTKGTQGASGFSVQPLRDAGRTLCAFTASALATVTTEALVSLTPYRDLVAGSAATTHAVTSGKRLRLQTLVVTSRATSTVNVGGLVRFRMLAGTVLVGSPVHASLGVMSSNLATAVIGNAQSFSFNFPEGFELSGSMQFGLTQLFSATTAAIDVHVLGYEY